MISNMGREPGERNEEEYINKPGEERMNEMMARIEDEMATKLKHKDKDKIVCALEEMGPEGIRWACDNGDKWGWWCLVKAKYAELRIQAEDEKRELWGTMVTVRIEPKTEQEKREAEKQLWGGGEEGAYNCGDWNA